MHTVPAYNHLLSSSLTPTRNCVTVQSMSTKEEEEKSGIHTTLQPPFSLANSLALLSMKDLECLRTGVEELKNKKCLFLFKFFDQ